MELPPLKYTHPVNKLPDWYNVCIGNIYNILLEGVDPESAATIKYWLQEELRYAYYNQNFRTEDSGHNRRYSMLLMDTMQEILRRLNVHENHSNKVWNYMDEFIELCIQDEDEQPKEGINFESPEWRSKKIQGHLKEKQLSRMKVLGVKLFWPNISSLTVYLQDSKGLTHKTIIS